MPFTSQKPQNQNFEKSKNLLEISSFYTRVPKIKIIWHTVHEIQIETDRIFCHFGQFFALLPPNDLMIYQSKFWKKMKKCLEILSWYTYMCAINENHMIYGSWNIRCDWQKFLSFWATFCPLSPLTTQEIKILKLKNIPGDTIILHICTINDNHMMHGSWHMEYTERIFCHSGLFFAFLLPYGPRKSKLKKKKKIWRYYHFTNVYHKWQSYHVWILRYGVQWTNFFVILDHFLPFYPLTTPKI